MRPRAILAALLLACAAPQAATQQQPTFKATTDIVVVDVQVSARNGTPIEGLKPDQFEVFIDGRRRAVQSVEFLRAVPTAGGHSAGSSASATPPSGQGDGRIFMLAIDEMSFPASARASAREAAQRVVRGLSPDDAIGMMTFPGSLRIAPTRDRAVIAEGIAQIGGVREPLRSMKFNLSASEASRLKSKESLSVAEIYERECVRRFAATDVFALQVCRQELMQEGTAIANALEHQGVTSINGLNDVVDSLASVAGRKVLIVVSAGIPLSNRPGGQPNLNAELARLSRRAAAANINLYVFYMNVHFLRYFSAEYGKQNHTIFDDITLFGYGLERFADAAGGSFAQIEVDADPFVDRVMRETAAYYLLAVPTEAADRDGREHTIRVSVSQRGANVQYRKVVIVPKG